MSEFVEVTILVPIKDIQIIDSKVEREEGDRHTPSGYDVSVFDIDVIGLNYEVADFDDANEHLNNKALQEWKEL